MGFLQLSTTINDYLDKNHSGSVDFNIIKDITERETGHIERNAELGLPIPLYIGLMGTFIGVIFGILFLFSGQEGAKSITEQSIYSFMGGIVIAMVGSLSGLLLTTISTNFLFKNAQVEVETRRNRFFTFVQMEVLPGLGETPADIMQAFMNGLKEFNDSFSANLGVFSGSLEMIQDNLSKQSQFLEQLERADFKTLISSSIQLVEKFERISINFGLLADYSDRAMIVFREIGNGADKANELLNRFGALDDHLDELSDEYKTNSLLVYEAVNFFKSKYQTLNNGVEILKNHLSTLDGEMDEFLKQESDRLKATTAGLVQSILQIYGELAEKEMISKLHENTVLMQKFEPVLKDITNKIKEDIASKVSLTQQLVSMSHSIESLNNKIPPNPIAQPRKFYNFIRNNGNHKG